MTYKERRDSVWGQPHLIGTDGRADDVGADPIAIEHTLIVPWAILNCFKRLTAKWPLMGS
jgi:hypothetical protein